jgi:hypothetical protein
VTVTREEDCAKRFVKLSLTVFKVRRQRTVVPGADGGSGRRADQGLACDLQRSCRVSVRAMVRGGEGGGGELPEVLLGNDSDEQLPWYVGECMEGTELLEAGEELAPLGKAFDEVASESVDPGAGEDGEEGGQ